MNEGRWTQKLLRELRRQMPGAVVFKHSDRFSGGVPDVSITREGRTSWLEIKMASSTKDRMFEPLQFETAKHLRAFYLIWSQEKKVGYLFLTSELLNTAWHETEPYTFAELVEKIVRTF